MGKSRYYRLYVAFYRMVGNKLSTGEVIHTLKVLTPDMEVSRILLLGTHKPAGKRESALPADVLSKIAEDIQRAITSRNGQQAGYGETLYELLMETLKSHLSIKKVLLQKYATQRKLDQFKQLLHRPRVSMTGTKKELLLKLAKLAADEYEKHLRELDCFFASNRFIRIDHSPGNNEALPILDEVQYLQPLLLTMYAVKHLRGNAVLDPGHENNTYTEAELAHALLRGKFTLPGAFLRVTAEPG